MVKKTSKVKKNSVKCEKGSVKKKKSGVSSQQKKVVKKKKTLTKKKKTQKTPSKKKKKVVKKSPKYVKNKTVKKRAVKKKIRRRKSRKISMEDIYKLLNKVQIDGKKLSFAVEFEEADVVENIVKDVGVKYCKDEMKTQILFKLEPSEKSPKYRVEIDEYFEDEITEEDEIDFDFFK